MQIEPYENEDGYRVWLSEREQQMFIGEFSEEPRKQVAVRAMLHGLRSDELQHLKVSNIRDLDADDEGYKLRVRDGKTGWREAPISRKLKEQMVMLKNAQGKRKTDPLVDVTKKTIQRWVSNKGEEIAERDGEDDEWRYLTPHDLRRSWATHTYYSIDAPYALEVVMRWGGWNDADTFRQNYLGRETDDMAVELMERAGLR